MRAYARVYPCMAIELIDWDGAYREEGIFVGPPPWNIGEPQPAFMRLINEGRIHSDVLDAGCGHAELSLTLAAKGHTVVGVDLSRAAIDTATATAKSRGIVNATFLCADITSLSGFDDRFSTLLDSTLFHSLPVESRDAYLRAMYRAAGPGASFFVLVFAHGAFPEDFTVPINAVTEDELRSAVAKYWSVDGIEPASIHALAGQVRGDDEVVPMPQLATDEKGRLVFPAYLLSAHKPA